MARLPAVLLTVLLLWPAAAYAQTTPSPEVSDAGCQAGQLCGSGDHEENLLEDGGTVADPPGRHLRSLVTLGAIAAVVGWYLFIALTGRKPTGRRRAAGPARG